MFTRSIFVLLALIFLLNIFSVTINSYVNHLVDVHFSSIIVVIMMFLVYSYLLKDFSYQTIPVFRV